MRSTDVGCFEGKTRASLRGGKSSVIGKEVRLQNKNKAMNIDAVFMGEGAVM